MMRHTDGSDHVGPGSPDRPSHPNRPGNAPGRLLGAAAPAPEQSYTALWVTAP